MSRRISGRRRRVSGDLCSKVVFPKRNEIPHVSGTQNPFEGVEPGVTVIKAIVHPVGERGRGRSAAVSLGVRRDKRSDERD